jgi:hypothetical protein
MRRRRSSVAIRIWLAPLLLLSVLVTASPASATVRTTEYPYCDPYDGCNRRCDHAYSSSGVYKLDFCASVGHTTTGALVGQVTLACRRVATNAEVLCKSMTNNSGELWACTALCGLSRHWQDSVPNVKRYVSVSSSYMCPSDRYFAYTAGYVSARFPDNTVVGSPTHLYIDSDSEVNYCPPV